MMRTTKTMYAAGLPDLGGWVCRAASFLPNIRLVVAGILFLLRRYLGVVVEVVEALQHLSSETQCFEFRFREAFVAV